MPLIILAMELQCNYSCDIKPNILLRIIHFKTKRPFARLSLPISFTDHFYYSQSLRIKPQTFTSRTSQLALKNLLSHFLVQASIIFLQWTQRVKNEKHIPSIDKHHSTSNRVKKVEGGQKNFLHKRTFFRYPFLSSFENLRSNRTKISKPKILQW